MATIINDTIDRTRDVLPEEYADLRKALTLIAGKWKLEILWLLYHRAHRFGELQKTIGGVTQHMLTRQLRELEADGLVTRTVFAEVPPRVEYSMTEATKALEPTIGSLMQWWQAFGRRHELPSGEDPERPHIKIFARQR